MCFCLEKGLFKLTTFLVVVSLLVPSFSPAAADTQEINNLAGKIQDKQKEIGELKRQSDLYKKNIEAKQSEILSLLNQTAILDNQIAKTDIDIRFYQAQIEETNFHIAQVQIQIQEKSKQIDDQKVQLSSFLAEINRQDQKSFLEVLLLNDSFSKFFDQVQYLEQAHEDLNQTLNEILSLKSQLEQFQNDLDARNKLLADSKQKLEEFRFKLESERAAKEILIAQTQNSEERFQNLLAQVKLEKRSLDREILDLENAIREKLQRNKKQFADLEAPAELIWPVPFQGIATFFHDADYIFRRWVGEHSGLDLRTLINGQPTNGVPVRAAASGTVIKVINNGRFTGNAIYIAHGGGLMTVYLHLSRIDVQEDDFVAIGKVIALSGGLPGTIGAGLSTGPHLHFEVRLEGIPVNPLEYLPRPVLAIFNE